MDELRGFGFVGRWVLCGAMGCGDGLFCGATGFLVER